MTKLRLLAAFLILVTTGAAHAAEKGTPSAAPAPQAVIATQSAAPTAPAFVPLKGEVPAPFFAAKTSCYVEKECCDGSIVSCTGTTCRVGPNKVVCDNIPHFCPICPW